MKQVTKISCIGPEIVKSIYERGEIKNAFYQVKANFKDIRSIEKMINTPILAKDLDIHKCRLKINRLLDESVNLLSGIKQLCSKYAELHSLEYLELQKRLYTILKRQPITFS